MSFIFLNFDRRYFNTQVWQDLLIDTRVFKWKNEYNTLQCNYNHFVNLQFFKRTGKVIMTSLRTAGLFAVFLNLCKYSYTILRYFSMSISLDIIWKYLFTHIILAKSILCILSGSTVLRCFLFILKCFQSIFIV